MFYNLQQVYLPALADQGKQMKSILNFITNKSNLGKKDHINSVANHIQLEADVLKLSQMLNH